MSSTQTRKVALLQYGCKTQNDQKHIFVNQIQRAALKNLSNKPGGDCSIHIMISLTYKNHAILPLSNNHRWLLYINFLVQITLRNVFLTSNYSKGQWWEAAKEIRGRTSWQHEKKNRNNWQPSLCESACHLPGLQSSGRIIWFKCYRINLSTFDNRFPRRKMHQITCTICPKATVPPLLMSSTMN